MRCRLKSSRHCRLRRVRRPRRGVANGRIHAQTDGGLLATVHRARRKSPAWKSRGGGEFCSSGGSSAIGAGAHVCIKSGHPCAEEGTNSPKGGQGGSRYNIFCYCKRCRPSADIVGGSGLGSADPFWREAEADAAEVLVSFPDAPLRRIPVPLFAIMPISPKYRSHSLL